MALGNNMYGDGFDSADINDALAQFTEDDWNNEAAECANDLFGSQTFMGLVNDIQGEGFTYDQAVYGANNFGVNWYSAAEIDAQNYIATNLTGYDNVLAYLETTLEYSHDHAVYGAGSINYFNVAKEIADGINTSYGELYNLLISYGFVHAEAQDACKAQDFTQKAKNRAQDYAGCDYYEIIDYLMNEGFTEEQAYAGSASTGAILSNDPCYIDANYYQTVMYPTCSEAEMVAYLTSCGYSPQRAALVADDIFNAKG